MDVSIAEAESGLEKLIQAVERGESVVITRDGKPVAQLTGVPEPEPPRREVRLGAQRGRITLHPGWDDPITLDQFLAGEF